MPYKSKGGKKKKSFKKGDRSTNPKFITRQEGHLQFYATVTKPTGNRHFMVKLLRHEGQDLTPFENSDFLFEKEFRGSLRGNIRKGKWVSPGDMVLVSLRDFNLKNINLDIILKYEYEESKYLKKKCKINTNKETDNYSDDISFEYNDIVPNAAIEKVQKNNNESYMNEDLLPSTNDYLEDNLKDDLIQEEHNVENTNENYDFDIDEI